VIQPGEIGLPVLETDAHQRMGRVLLEAWLAQKLDQVRLGAWLPQPAQGDGGRLAVVDVIVA